MTDLDPDVAAAIAEATSVADANSRAGYTLDHHVVLAGEAFVRQQQIARLRYERRCLELQSMSRPTPEKISRLIVINNELNELLTATLVSLASV
jgi:hypothetical protein